MPNTAGSDNNRCDSLSGKKIILGVTGGIAAYKAAYLASALVQRGADVHVIMTEHATKLIGPPTFWSLTKNEVVTDMFAPPKTFEITHVSLSEKADLLLIAPATANIIGKLANGLADDMLSTTALAARCPIVTAPAMNPRMYSNAIFAGNLDRLRQHGFVIVEPEEGRLACGDEGVGRLADIERILAVVEQTLAGGARDYSGVKVLVTAGPTREPIDPVRYISNRSSGKMGYAIAENAARRGAQVTLVTGPTELPDPRGVEVVRVTSVREMYEAVMSRVDGTQVVISAAAPADFTPREVREEKIKKSERLTLELDRAVDILDAVGKKRNGKVLVGFAAETSNLEEHARAKLHKKNLDLIVANLISPASEPFGSDTNQVTLIAANGEKIEWPKMTKREIAAAILDYVKDQYLEDMT